MIVEKGIPEVHHSNHTAKCLPLGDEPVVGPSRRRSGHGHKRHGTGAGIGEDEEADDADHDEDMTTEVVWFLLATHV